MGKHRSRLKILANILSVVSAESGAKKTQIMYKAYLSYKLLVQYLNDITEAGLIICGEETCYKLTPKGEKFLARFVEYEESRNAVEQKLDYIADQRLMLEKMCPTAEVANADSKHSGKKCASYN